MSQTLVLRRGIVRDHARTTPIKGPMVIIIRRREFVSALGNFVATPVKGATANDPEGTGYG
jgi:hypothetical protein